jgi:UDP-GlcNAc3NAcA epimerase
MVPLHPRTRKQLEKLNITSGDNRHVHTLKPVSYLDMVALEKNAKAILTDSGGVQKEAYFANVPCITLRDETEWVETTKDGSNRVVGTEINEIIRGYHEITEVDSRASSSHYGDGHSGEKIIELLNSELNWRR